TNQPQDAKPETIRLSVDASGSFFWNDEAVDDAGLAVRLKAEAAKSPQPELHIRGDKDVRYERVAQAMAAAQVAGVKKIGFVTEPKTP
ncbi:MAG: biopolymer transporter ExbD, partial [Rhodoferax sp.]|nr:biopolymer transporter ExbD [Rhodoferax sp.]